ncbi:MAG: SufD family Fe-S cluster assembly protein, partial [Oscillospiraceae bacterium]|nr:SufD family Fe-S cluster assembly protein [Oscillospiraceae bacterium]
FELNGEDSSVQLISRSVAKDNSRQVFSPLVVGKAACRGHVQCDSILIGNGQVKSVPAIEAECPDAILMHEAAIGKIAGDQIIKLQTLGLTEEEAEQEILDDFLS